MIKQILVFARKSMKLTILIGVSIFLIICAVVLFFKPIYSVTINGEFVGYSGDKSKLQEKINEYIEKGENGENSKIAFVQVDNLPEYKLCLLKRNIITNDDEIFEKVKETGIPYYNYYAVLEGETEKAYVSSFQEGEQIVAQLKEKNSNNIDQISIREVYETELKEFSTVEDTVSALYVKKVEPVVAKKNTSTTKPNTSRTMSYQSVPLGINLIKPISGTISSRFGGRSSGQHTGLDIAAPYGTPIKAAASGTVTYSNAKRDSKGRYISYGELIIIKHDNGVETYYGHCSARYVKEGQHVNQGDVIGAVGSTGNSTGNHLHLEIRINGVAYNPQNYLY